MTRNNDHALTVRLPRELYEQVRAVADAEERTVAWVLRRLARQYVDGLKAPGKIRRNLPDDTK